MAVDVYVTLHTSMYTNSAVECNMAQALVLPKSERERERERVKEAQEYAT